MRLPLPFPSCPSSLPHLLTPPRLCPWPTRSAGLPLATEFRDGCDRNKFRHWNSGDNPTDGCNMRAEVLLHAAVDPPNVGLGCRLVGGSWVGDAEHGLVNASP